MIFLPRRHIPNHAQLIEACPYSENILECLRGALTNPLGPQGPQGVPYRCCSCELGRAIRQANGVGSISGGWVEPGS